LSSSTGGRHDFWFLLGSERGTATGGTVSTTSSGFEVNSPVHLPAPVRTSSSRPTPTPSPPSLRPSFLPSQPSSYSHDYCPNPPLVPVPPSTCFRRRPSSRGTRIGSPESLVAPLCGPERSLFLAGVDRSFKRVEAEGKWAACPSALEGAERAGGCREWLKEVVGVGECDP
jgi:hypothetical protein